MRADAPGCVWAVREPVLFRSVLHDRETGVALTMPLIPTPFHTVWAQSGHSRGFPSSRLQNYTRSPPFAWNPCRQLDQVAAAARDRESFPAASTQYRTEAGTSSPALGRLARLVQGTVCKILGQEEIKPHKVRYYLERRDAEFEQKMAEVLCVYREVQVPIKDWSLTSLKEKLIKIGAKVVSHGRYVAFQMAQVAIPRQMFQEILRLIAELRPQRPPAPA